MPGSVRQYRYTLDATGVSSIKNSRVFKLLLQELYCKVCGVNLLHLFMLHNELLHCIIKVCKNLFIMYSESACTLYMQYIQKCVL